MSEEEQGEILKEAVEILNAFAMVMINDDGSCVEFEDLLEEGHWEYIQKYTSDDVVEAIMEVSAEIARNHTIFKVKEERKKV